MNNHLASELILNDNGTVYHLGLSAEDVASTIITVGDQNRVSQVSKYFDRIEFKNANREFTTHTGYIGKKRVSVLSTGIGVDNIDIVFNELDILSSIDLSTKKRLIKPRQLDIIRLGTTGSINPNIKLDDIVFSKMAIGLDGVPYHYSFDTNLFDNSLSDEFIRRCKWSPKLAVPYSVSCSNNLWDKLYEESFKKGITVTMNGFYGPQSRSIRIPLKHHSMLQDLQQINYKNLRVSNLEMETAGLYAFGKIFSHQVLSISTVLAHRIERSFSSNAEKAIDKMILLSLPKIEKLNKE